MSSDAANNTIQDVAIGSDYRKEFRRTTPARKVNPALLPALRERFADLEPAVSDLQIGESAYSN